MASPPRFEEQTDDALMRHAQAGDADAFAELYDRYCGLAYRVARLFSRDAGQAEDAVQEGFLAIWRSRSSYREGVAGFQAWAMRIVRNRAIDSGRRAAARPRLQTAGDDGGRPWPDTASLSTQDAMVAEGERDAMLSSLRLLPEAQSEVILLAFYGELSHSEIASRLGLPAGTVKGRMRLGLAKLRLDMAIRER